MMKLVKIILIALMAMTSLNGIAQDRNQAALDNIFSRKSVRSYTDQPVSPEQVETGEHPL